MLPAFTSFQGVLKRPIVADEKFPNDLVSWEQSRSRISIIFSGLSCGGCWSLRPGGPKRTPGRMATQKIVGGTHILWTNLATLI